MKKSVLLLKEKMRISLLLLVIGLFSTPAFALTYTATASGNWGSSATWAGGIAPSFNLTTDAVVIPSGITVTMDNSVSITGVLASVDVVGTLTSNSSMTLTVGGLGTLSGTGNIGIGTLDLQSGSVLTFTGPIAVGTMNTAIASLQLGANVTVAQMLNLSAGTLSIQSGGSVTIASGGKINISGGLLAQNGGSLMLTSSYNVVYSGGSATTGVELGGTGLNNVTINVSPGNTVTMVSNLTVAGNLSLASGSLVVGANTLTISGNLITGGSGTITSTGLSNITVNTTGGISGALNFSANSMVNNFTINVGSGNQVQVGGGLNVTGALALTSGTLNFNGGNLTIDGSLTGSGTLSGNGSSNLTINTSGGLSGSLNFAAGGQTVNNLNINVGSGNSVTIGTGLTVAGALNLSGGSNLNISGQTITVNGDLTGTGTFTANNSSGLAFNTSSSLSSAINVSGGSIGTLTVNVGSGNTASLGGNISVTGSLNLQSGTLNLSGHDLTISGSITGRDSILSTSSSGITINTSGGTGGVLNFATGSFSNNITIAVGNGNQAQISGSVNVTGTLALTSGSLNFSGGSLTIGGAVTGSGTLSGNGSSNLTINTAGGLSGSLNFASEGQVVNNLTLNVGSGNSVTLGTGLAVGGTLSLSGGSNLNINGDTLTLGGNLTGTGSLLVNTNTAIILNSNGGLSTPLSINGTLGTLLVNVGSGNSITLGGNVTVSNVISLQSGALALNGNNLSITGDIAGGGTGTITSNGSSGIVINTALTTTGGLTFTGGSNTIGTLSVNTAGSLSIASNITITDSLGLNGGTINMGSDTLSVAAGGWITGGDSSAYVIATGTGALGLQVTTGNSGWVNFPVGTNTNFAPISVQLNTGSSSAGTVYVTTNGEVLSQGTTGTNLSGTQPVVNITWMVEPSLTSNINLNLMAMWSTALQVNGFNPDSAYVSHFINGSWNASAASSASIAANGLYQLELSGVTSFSPFAVFGSKANSATSIAQVAGDDNQFDIYPNPVSANLIVKNMSGNNQVYAEIIDINGQVIARYQFTDLTNNLSLSKLTAGNYFIRLFNDNLNEVKKFIKM